MLGNIDPAKYPKAPNYLWDKDAGVQTFEQLKFLALAMASNGAEIRKSMQ